MYMIVDKHYQSLMFMKFMSIYGSGHYDCVGRWALPGQLMYIEIMNQGSELSTLSHVVAQRPKAANVACWLELHVYVCPCFVHHQAYCSLSNNREFVNNCCWFLEFTLVVLDSCSCLHGLDVVMHDQSSGFEIVAVRSHGEVGLALHVATIAFLACGNCSSSQSNIIIIYYCSWTGFGCQAFLSCCV